MNFFVLGPAFPNFWLQGRRAEEEVVVVEQEEGRLLKATVITEVDTGRDRATEEEEATGS